MKTPSRQAEKLDHARWLLERSDHLRASYATRAALVLGIDAVAIASLFASLATQWSANRVYAIASCLILCCVLASVWCALLASGTVFSPNARKAAHSPDIGMRRYLSPTDTFGGEIRTFAQFREAFHSTDPDTLLEYILAELAVDLKLQGQRYRWLKWSMRLLFLSMILLAFLYVSLLA